MNHELRSRNDEESGFIAEERESGKGRSSWSVWQYATAVLLVFPVICIPILFGLVANANKTTKNYYQGTATASFTATSAIAEGTVVSFTENGKVQHGAGTSIYKNIVDVTLSCPAHLSMDSVFGNTYLLSYADATTKKASLQVVTVSSSNPDEGIITYTKATDYQLTELVTLNSATGLFVAISQDLDETAATGFVVAGQVSSQTNTVGELVASEEYGGVYSVNPVITRLSDTTFAIAYYSDAPTQIMTRYGKVDPATLAITLYDAAVLLDDQANSYYFSMVGMTASSYLMVFHNTTVETQPYYGYGQLEAKLATVSTDTGAVTTTDASALANSAAIYSLAVTSIDDTTAVVAYANYYDNSGIRTQVIQLEQLENSATTNVVFGSSWLLTSGTAAAVVKGGMQDLDIATVAEEQASFVVLYSDISNKGAMTATMGQITSAGEIERASADFLLNAGNSDVESTYSWAALAPGLTAPLASRTGLLTSVTNQDCSATPVTKFAMMEVLPKQLGMVSTTSSSTASSTEVVLAGTVSFEQGGLATGRVYYSNTKGELIASDSYWGRESAAQFYYYTDASTDTIVAQDAKVGFASTTTAIVV